MELDTKTLIHVATEFLVVGGVSFWLNKKITTLNHTVEELQGRVNAYEGILKRLIDLGTKHENMLSQIVNGGYPPQNPPPRQRISGDEKDVLRRVSQNPQNNPQNVPQNTPRSDQEYTPIPNRRPFKSPPIEPIQILEEEDISDEELDEMINKELENADMFGDDDRTELKSDKKKN